MLAPPKAEGAIGTVIGPARSGPGCHMTCNPFCPAACPGQIGYALAPQIARGAMFGPHQRVELRLLDIETARPLLEGVCAELADCCYPLLEGAAS